MNPAPDAPDRRPPRKPKLRDDLLDPAEARLEMKKRLANVIPDLPALGLVIIFGAGGALLSWIWGQSMPLEKRHGIFEVCTYHWLLAAALGVTGAVAAVFLLARTDTSKLIHCSLVALFAGMSGPQLVLKALGTVNNMEAREIYGVPQLPNDLAQLAQLNKETEKTVRVSATLQANETPGPQANPAELVRTVDETREAVVALLRLSEQLSKDKPQAANQVLEKSREPIKTAIKNLGEASERSPQKALQALVEIKQAAEAAGATEITSAVQTAITEAGQSEAAVTALENAPQLFFITPPKMDDADLQYLRAQLQQQYPTWAFAPTIHPRAAMEDGLEIVRYGESAEDVKTAQALADYVKKYFGVVKAPAVRPFSLPRGERRSQFDLHIGPDVVDAYRQTLLQRQAASTKRAQPSPTPRPRGE